MAVGLGGLLKFRWQSLQESLGLPGWLGILGGIIGGLLIWHTHHLMLRVPEITKQISKKQLLSTSKNHSMIPAVKLELPTLGEYEGVLKNIILLTEKNTISVVGGSYTVKTLQNSKIKIIEITFPLSGTYFQIKHFLAELLNAVPNASLQAVKLTQPNKASELLDVEAVILLYFLGSSSQ